MRFSCGSLVKAGSWGSLSLKIRPPRLWESLSELWEFRSLGCWCWSACSCRYFGLFEGARSWPFGWAGVGRLLSPSWSWPLILFWRVSFGIRILGALGSTLRTLTVLKGSAGSLTKRFLAWCCPASASFGTSGGRNPHRKNSIGSSGSKRWKTWTRPCGCPTSWCSKLFAEAISIPFI